ncbi:hypothetical protein I316_03464 [Kwoniella heveanensis BCC8398]|uniref:PX domain-containing protein n=1 Tax=Kwoniella heveanensis BCC8398 TaxID=1296120 RepID=A0A1B9GV58_9TREE|nr:hypothetical protein I316_03464 [Kwoniella heveanensis BCC8398]
MDDPLSPSNINAGWAESPTDSTPSFSALPPLSGPASASASSASNFDTPTTASGTGFEREGKVFGAPGLTLVDPPSSSSSSSTQRFASPPNHNHAQQIGSTAGGRKEAPSPYIRVRIGGLERNRKDLLIRFDASTNLPNFRTSLYRNMQRSYVEFQKFAEQAQLVCPQTIIPALPLPSTSAVTDEEDDRLVRIALQRWLTRICEDPILMKDDELRAFIESDFGYSPVPPPSARRNTAASTATGVFSAALSKVVRRGPLDEDDELQSAKGALDKLEERWGGAAAAVGNLGKARRALAQSNADVGAKLISLSTVESDMQLAAAERKIGRTWEHMSGMMGGQAASENVILSDSLGYQALNARAAKDALVQRTTLLEDSQTATKAAINKRRNLERLKGSSKIDPARVDDAIHEMQEADALETSLSSRLNAISSNLHLAIRTHSRHAHEDVAVALLEAARMSVMYHKQSLRELEALKPDLARVGTNAPIPQTNSARTTPKRSTIGLPATQNQQQGPVLDSVSGSSQNRPPPPLMQPSFSAGPISSPSQNRSYHQAQANAYSQQGMARPPPPVPAAVQQPPYGSGIASQYTQPPQQHQQAPYMPPSQSHAPQQPYTPQVHQPRGFGMGGPPPSGAGMRQPQPQPQPHLQHQSQPQMNGTQSMFLPLPSHVQGGGQRPHSAGPFDPLAGQFSPSGPVAGPSPPGHMTNSHGPGPGGAYSSGGGGGMPNRGQGMAQSMMLPQGQGQGYNSSARGQPSGTPGVGAGGRGGTRRLDERQAARMLAGGF